MAIKFRGEALCPINDLHTSSCSLFLSQANTPCNRNGVRRQPLGVDSAVMGSSILSFNDSSPFYSLTSFTYEQEITYVVAGGIGTIEQVCIIIFFLF